MKYNGFPFVSSYILMVYVLFHKHPTQTQKAGADFLRQQGWSIQAHQRHLMFYIYLQVPNHKSAGIWLISHWFNTHCSYLIVEWFYTGILIPAHFLPSEKFVLLMLTFVQNHCYFHDEKTHLYMNLHFGYTEMVNGMEMGI